MKKIIDGKLYDTTKSELVVRFRRWVTLTNPFRGEYEDWVECELYRTRKGHWFEVEGTDTRNPQMNAITPERAKSIIKVDPDKFCEMYPDEVEEA